MVLSRMSLNMIPEMLGLDRYRSFNGITPLLFLLLIVCFDIAQTTAYAFEKPNIIFVVADDLGYGDLSCYGQKNFRTPNIDRMASEGLLFTQHYSGSTVCAPSRACLLAGQHTGHVYQRANSKYGFRPDPDDICVASLLKQAGYQTAMIGKSGLSCNSKDKSFPNEKGFDHFFGYISHGAAHRYFPKKLVRNGKSVTYPANHGEEGKTYSGDEFLTDSLKWIEDNKNKPFFLHLALQQPHLDLSVPEEWKQPYLGKFAEEPIKAGHYRAEKNPKATFAGMVTYLDDTVGQVLAKVKEAGIAEKTLVIFSSDNGAMTTGGWSSDNMNSCGPLRGCKRDLYEGGIRVPFIAWWPGKISAGTTTDHISTFWDFMPTACELAQIESPSNIDGISYLPTLLAKENQKKHKYLYWEFYEQGGKQAVRWGDWKAIRLNALRKSGKSLELYNLEEDLSEENNLADTHPEILSKMLQFMKQSHTPTEHHRISF